MDIPPKEGIKVDGLWFESIIFRSSLEILLHSLLEVDLMENLEILNSNTFPTTKNKKCFLMHE